jgi:phosphatidylglycerophosphatase A
MANSRLRQQAFNLYPYRLKYIANPPGDEPPDTEKEEEYSFLKSIRDIGFFIAVCLYLMGWVYVSYYLKEFGISIRQVDIDFYNLITYSIDVIRYIIDPFVGHFWTLDAPSILAIILLFFLYRRYRQKITSQIKALKKRRAFKIIQFLVSIVIIGMAYGIAYLAATYNKNRDQIDKETTLRSVRFKFKEENEKVTVEGIGTKRDSVSKKLTDDELKLIKYNKNGELKILMADKETYYVFRFDPTLTWDDVGSAVNEVFLIQREDVLYAKITH